MMEMDNDLGDGSEEEGNQGRRSTLRRGSLPASARSSSEWEQSSEEESEDNSSRAGRPLRRRIPQPVQKEPMNVDGFWSTNRLKRVMKREILLRIGVEFSPAQWRQVYLAIQRVHLQTPEINNFIDQLYSSKATPSQIT